MPTINKRENRTSTFIMRSFRECSRESQVHGRGFRVTQVSKFALHNGFLAEFISSLLYPARPKLIEKCIYFQSGMVLGCTSLWTAPQILWSFIYVICGSFQLMAAIFFVISVKELALYGIVFAGCWVRK